MKKSDFSIISYAMLFLLFIQLGGTLVASIYTLDLLHTSLDAKALGLLFFFSPVLFFFFKKPYPGWMVWLFAGILLLTRGILPGLDTNGRMLVSGIGIAACLGLFPYLLSQNGLNEENRKPDGGAALGLSFAIVISIMLRSVNSGIDYSLVPGGIWVGWLIGLVLCISLAGGKFTTPDIAQIAHPPTERVKGLTSSILGILLVITLIYFIYSAPAVMARWTEGSYPVIVLAISLISIGWFFARILFPQFFDWFFRRNMVLWNILLLMALVSTTLFHRVIFPENPDSHPVIVAEPEFWQQIPLILLVLLLPVLFMDLEYLWGYIQKANASPRQMASGLVIGSFTLVVLVFMNIFTNVWGYVEPVSPFFRNKFYLPFLVLSVLLCLVVFLNRNRLGLKIVGVPEGTSRRSFPWVWGLVMIILFLLTVNGVRVKGLQTVEHQSDDSLTVMTYNIQQGNDVVGEQSYLQQLALIQDVNPDILVLQECDSTRISLNNIDLVRFFAENLGYYSYYGPKTVSGSYGTAIISRYPLINTKSIFSFSDQDENGTAYAQVDVGGKVFNIYNVHPDGSDDAKIAFAKMLLEFTADQRNVIIMGDFNLRDYEDAYQMIDNVFTNSWIDSYPTGISSDGLDMSGKNRIDHIFISSDLSVRNPVYILPPESETDHPVHWAQVYWQD